jgi:hypothetical protein
LDEVLAKQTNDLLKIQTTEYIQFIKEFTNTTEIMAREYEKEKGMEVGSISSGVAKKHTREEVVLTGKKKKEEAIKKRRKSLGT